MKQQQQSDKWQFFIDRGGTFTDVVALAPDGQLHCHKLLSDNPEQYRDAALQGMHNILQIPASEKLPLEKIATVKMGTTVATNALLERQGEPTVLVITKGFTDALRIAYQNRPDIFALEIKLPEMLYSQAIAAEERVDAQGEIIKPLDIIALKPQLQKVYDQGIRSLACVLMHAYQQPQHELQIAELAKQIGFQQISLSHQVSPLIKLISRGDTTVVDAYLTPVLRRYIDSVASELENVALYFMQSNGGLAHADFFQGKDSILSGPAGGVIGAVRVGEQAGFSKIVGFDMGGTSTDICQYCGELERTFDNVVAGVRMRVPMMLINTIAAGGGSILHFEQGRYQVGPDSAGANPGPCAYGRDGPLTVTDCNVLLGRLPIEYFPKIFGKDGKQALQVDSVKEKFSILQKQIHKKTGEQQTVEQVASGFLHVAINNMASAIKKITVQRGFDVSEYLLCCFGGAAGQHACKVADALGVDNILLHPLAGVLSAYGIGLADIRVLREKAVEKIYQPSLHKEIQKHYQALATQCRELVEQQSVIEIPVTLSYSLRVRYQGSDAALLVPYTKDMDILKVFTILHRQRYGFVMQQRQCIIEAVIVEACGVNQAIARDVIKTNLATELTPASKVNVYIDDAWQQVPVYLRDNIPINTVIKGPALITEATTNYVIESGWQVVLREENNLLLSRHQVLNKFEHVTEHADPVMLEIFNNLFMSIAEQMGVVLANTAYSVNIKERLDFSCAVFDEQGSLVANAPHMPVHLGSMGESVRAVITCYQNKLQPGDVYMLNNPYQGGTHLPDITVITPVFLPQQQSKQPQFFVASRGHHADVGGITPGSMPHASRTITEEGALIDCMQIVKHGIFCEKEITHILTEAMQWPVRNVQQNLGDLQAQIAANETGMQGLRKMIEHFGLTVVTSYMKHVQDNAEQAVREVITCLHDGEFCYPMDNGAEIKVKITVDKQQRSAIIDFTGTSAQQENNFNAPFAVCRAAVLYVFRSLIKQAIPLNEGCLKPLTIIVPENSMLRPCYPAAVVAGNVETSQVIVDSLFAALGKLAASQGTMNNFTFGNDQYQYYETLCGGAGAGEGFHGCDAVHTHMTNSRLTDPEILELYFPVQLEEFSIRTDSAGVGKWHGGQGVLRAIRFLEEMEAMLLTGHRKIAPFGLCGGTPGAVGENWLLSPTGKSQRLAATVHVNAKKGDVILIKTPGGGGFGA